MDMEAMANRVVDYVRIRRAEKKPDPEEIHRGLQQGLQIEHPEKIMGYAGFFRSLGDIYASGYIAGEMDRERFRNFVTDSLKRFDKGDFGDISESDRSANIDDRYLFGINRAFGRYGYFLSDRDQEGKDPFYEVICIREHDGNTWVTCDSEPDWFLFLEEEHIKMLRDKKWEK